MLISMITKLNGISEIFISFAQKEILYSTILFILIAPIPLLLKKRSVFWQFGFWSLLMIRLILPPDLSHPLSGRNLAHSLFKLNTINLINLPNTFSLYQRVYQESDIHINSLEFKDLNKTNTTDRIFSGLSLPITWQSYLFMVWALGIMVFLLIYLKRIRRAFLFPNLHF